MMDTYKAILVGDIAPDEDTKKKLRSESVIEGREIFVTPEIVRGVLDKYLSGEVDAKQLSSWAAFLVSNDIYVTPGWEDDTQADKFEPMWEVLQQLSSPFIDGPITKDSVKSFIDELLEIES